MNSQQRPSETAKVERSWPTLTTTCAPVGSGASARRRCRERAQHRERLEVDAGEPDAGLPAREDVAVDELAVGDDEQNAPDVPGPSPGRRAPTSTCQSSTASSSGIGSVSCARKRIAFASCRGSSMPVISKVRTPMRLFAMPRRTPRFGSLCFAKSSLSAAARPSMSRNSPPTTTPSGRSIRARPGGAPATRSSWRPARPRSATRRSSARRARPYPGWEPSASCAPSGP